MKESNPSGARTDRRAPEVVIGSEVLLFEFAEKSRPSTKATSSPTASRGSVWDAARFTTGPLLFVMTTSTRRDIVVC